MYSMANKYYAVVYGGGTCISVPSRESGGKKLLFMLLQC